jgi:spermidine/putrescine transport system permease protein
MTAVAESRGKPQGKRGPVAAPAPARPKRRRFDVKTIPGFAAMAWFCIVALYTPIAVLVAYSFNDNNTVVIWAGFSIRWYGIALGDEEIRDAALLSLKVAFIASLFATTFATMAAIATTRVPNYRGLTFIYAVINQPLMVPEIVTGIATIVFFGLIRQATHIQSIGYLITAHIVFCIPFAYLPIRARLEDMDRTYETAAADLYASPWKTFQHVTFPLLVPGILGGAMLAFLVSLDDVVISVLVAGPGDTTLPLYVVSQIKRGITPELNAMATMFLCASIILATTFFLITRRKAK